MLLVVQFSGLQETTQQCVHWELGTNSVQLRERKNGPLAPKRLTNGALGFFDFVVGIQAVFAFFLPCKLLVPLELVGTSGFEPPASWPRTSLDQVKSVELTAFACAFLCLIGLRGLRVGHRRDSDCILRRFRRASILLDVLQGMMVGRARP